MLYQRRSVDRREDWVESLGGLNQTSLVFSPQPLVSRFVSLTEHLEQARPSLDTRARIKI